MSRMARIRPTLLAQVESLRRDIDELTQAETLDLELLARLLQQVRQLNARLQELQNRALGLNDNLTHGGPTQ